MATVALPPLGRRPADNGLAIGGDWLPAPGCRFTARRKAQIVAAIHAGRISADEVCETYNLSITELAEWQRGDVTRKHIQRRRYASGIITSDSRRRASRLSDHLAQRVS